MEHAKGEDTEFDFNRFVPYPEEYSRLDAEASRWHAEHKNDETWWMKYPTDGFNSGGYDWCVENWGTKWNARRVGTSDLWTFDDEARAELSFATAWSPPAPVVKRASELFPELTLTLCYFECGMEFNGIYRCRGGEVLRDEAGPYFGHRGG